MFVTRIGVTLMSHGESKGQIYSCKGSRSEDEEQKMTWERSRRAISSQKLGE